MFKEMKKLAIDESNANKKIIKFCGTTYKK